MRLFSFRPRTALEGQLELPEGEEPRQPRALEGFQGPSVEAVRDASVESQDLSVWYGPKSAVHKMSLRIPPRKVTAIIGPSGCGKSTVLRAINRMNDTIPHARTEGRVVVDGENVYDDDVDPVALRRKVGLIFQAPNPFPKSVYENVAFGVRLHYEVTRRELDAIVESALRAAHLWDEVADRLDDTAHDLSGGQQQRLCIGRALAVEPSILLMDEPCSALDPIATARIEDLIFDLKKEITVVIVTHNMQQAARVADYTAFMYLGRLIEFGRTREMFEHPKQDLTEQYITGRFG